MLQSKKKKDCRTFHPQRVDGRKEKLEKEKKKKRTEK
jgi:hypothetical protein